MVDTTHDPRRGCANEALNAAIIEDVRRWQRDQDFAARDRIVQNVWGVNLRMVRRYRGFGDVEHFISHGAEGILIAIDQFDPDRGVAFSTYLTWHLRNAHQRALRSRTLIRVPAAAFYMRRRGIKFKYQQAANVAMDFRATGVTEARGGALAHVRDDRGPWSRHADAAECVEEVAHLLQRVRRTEPFVAQVLEMRFGVGDRPDAAGRPWLERGQRVTRGLAMTHAEIGAVMGLCKERIRQLEAQGLRMMRRFLEAEESNG